MCINIQNLDIFDDLVEYLTEDEKDELLERVHKESLEIKIPTVPSQCALCDNWVGNYYEKLTKTY